MSKLIKWTSMFILIICASNVEAQIVAPKFGKGLQIMAADSSFSMKVGLRFQTLLLNEWNVVENVNGTQLEDYQSSIFIRRSRLKFNGFAFSPKLKYKMELALSNRDNGGGNSSNFSNAANIILDAAVEWNFYKNLSLWAGQGKMPGNRERIISSGNLQFVDRSRLNSRFTLDRDVGIMLKNKSQWGNFILRQTVSMVSGEGKNITSGNVGGYAYTFKLEALPFGKFLSKGDYIGSSIKRNKTPKLAIAAAYEINQRAGRERGQKGDFIVDYDGAAHGKDIASVFVDLMFKYDGLSIMAEYASRSTTDGDANVYALNVDGDMETIGTYYTGSAINLSAGYFIMDGLELAARWTQVNPDEEVARDETQYTFGVSKYIVGHKLKVQSDITYRDILEGTDELFYRMQFDLHF